MRGWRRAAEKGRMTDRGDREERKGGRRWSRRETPRQLWTQQGQHECYIWVHRLLQGIYRAQAGKQGPNSGWLELAQAWSGPAGADKGSTNLMWARSRSVGGDKDPIWASVGQVCAIWTGGANLGPNLGWWVLVWAQSELTGAGMGPVLKPMLPLESQPTR